MADKMSVAVDIPEQQNLNETVEKPTYVSITVPTETPPTKTSRIGAIVGLIGFIIASVLPILQLYIGSRYVDNCPVDWHIPHYLIIAGAAGIIVVILGIIQNALKLKVSLNYIEQPPKVGATLGLLCVIILIVIFLLFLCIWFFFGIYWVSRSWNTVQYVNPNEKNYCHPTLYRFAFWSIIFSLIFKCTSSGQSCVIVPAEIKNLKFAKISATVITEP